VLSDLNNDIGIPQADEILLLVLFKGVSLEFLEIGSFLVEAPEDNAYLGDCLLDILLLSRVTFEVVIGLFQVFKIILDPLKTLS
jgi:hypothetical protein